MDDDRDVIISLTCSLIY